MVDFLDRDRRSNSVRPSRIGQGIKSPRRPNFAQNMHPLNGAAAPSPVWLGPHPNTPNVNHGVAVGRPRGFCFITPIAFVGSMGGWCCGAPYSLCKWIASVLYSCRWCWDVRCVVFSRWREHNFRCGGKTRTKSQTSIILPKKGGPRRRPTKLEAAAINRWNTLA